MQFSGFTFCIRVANIIAVILLSMLLVSCSTAPIDANNSIKAGDQLLSAGDAANALLAWQQVQISSPDTVFDLELRKCRAFRELGLNKQAKQSAQLALEQLSASSDPQKSLYAELELALAELTLSQWDSARSRLVRIRIQAEPLMLWTELAQVELGLALLDKVDGKVDSALQHYQSAVTYARRSGNNWMLVNAQLLQLSLLAKQNAALASNIWPEIVGQVQNLPVSKRRTMALIKLVRIAQTYQLFSLADKRPMELLQEAEASGLALKDERLRSYAIGYQGTALEQQSDYEKALELTNKAAAAAQRALAMESLYLWEWQAGRLHHLRHRDDLALSAFQRAVDNLQQIRDSQSFEQSFSKEVSPLYSGLADLLLKKAATEQDAKQKQLLLVNARKTLEKLKTAELQDYFQDRCVVRFKEKSQGLEQVLQQTAVVYPILLPDRTEIIVSFSDGLKQYIVPVGSGPMNAEIHDFRKKLEKRSTFSYLKPAKQLYSWLLAPLLADLEAHRVDTLVIVPDGALRTIPFAALYDGQHYAVERFAFATTPGLSLTDPKKLPFESMTALINGLTESVQGFSALPNVDRELKTIQQELGGEMFKNERFQIEDLRTEMTKNPYRIVHIASHGQFDKDPQKTFLLTYNGRATMDILEKMLGQNKYKDNPVELLTLSACQTAAGDDRAALGMAGVAIKAGVRSALASLWFINDQSSSDLVAYFYEQLKDNRSKAQALRLAQLELRKDTRYRHATYWAPFLLIGNWM